MKLLRQCIGLVGMVRLVMLFLVTLVLSYFDDWEKPDGMA